MTTRPPRPADDHLDLLPSLRGLARGLVRDEGVAEDLAHDALHAAARRGRSIRDVRRFAAGVIRKKALQRHRAEARRHYHEGLRAAAAGEADLESPDRIIERVEVIRVVLEEIRNLPPAQSRAIALRYIDELAVIDIATREGSAPSTVRSHLSRGLQTLRERLDARFGERAAWSSVLAPWAREGAVESGISVSGTDPTARVTAQASIGAAGGALVTMAALKTALIVGTLAAAGTWLVLVQGDEIDPLPVEPPPDAVVERIAEDGATVRTENVASLTAAPGRRARTFVAGESPPAGPTSAVPAEFPVEGRVVDARNGMGVPGLKVTVAPEGSTSNEASWTLVTDDEGRFRTRGEGLTPMNVRVLPRDAFGRRAHLREEGALAFPFEADIAVDVEPTIRFAIDGIPLPDEAVVRVESAPRAGFQAVLQPGQLPWARFNAPLPWTIEALRLTLEDSYLYGVASVTGGDDRFDDP
ncbi:MAG: sigma-70 family RNA polymerase sigma factor, partial [Planctomycetota bacterium]